jgi:Ca2+-binding EF-hand superfamily protein
MTFNSEKQLRRIFDGFDYNQSGTGKICLHHIITMYVKDIKTKITLQNLVDLDEFHHAIEYCKNQKSFHRLTTRLDYLENTFVAMDTDGDATVDFQEFCIGMTGRAKGPFEGMSDSDINRLIDAFLDYANHTKRKHIVQSIEDDNIQDGDDYKKFKSFVKLFTAVKKKSETSSSSDSMQEEVKDPEAEFIKNQIEDEKRLIEIY